MNTLLKGFIGTYTNGSSKGIYNFTYNCEKDKFIDISLSCEASKPSYLVVDKDNKTLYSIIKKGNQGGVASFNIDINNLNLDLVDINVTEGNPPCHLSLNNENGFLFSSNYHDNKLESYLTNINGKIRVAYDVQNNKGEAPHIHYANLTPNGKFLCSLDLGLDKMFIYELSNDNLIKRDDLTIFFSKGSGPRHMSFHPTKNYAYVLTEYTCELAVFKFDNEGHFTLIKLTSTLPHKYYGVKSGAAIHVHPNGNYIYTSNRGHNSISSFKINKETGNVVLLDHKFTLGSTPRDFDISQDGDYIIAANQDSSSLVAFKLDQNTGKLSNVLDSIEVPNPVCVKFY